MLLRMLWRNATRGCRCTRRTGRSRQDRHRGAISRRAEPGRAAVAPRRSLRVEFLSRARCRVFLAGIAPVLHARRLCSATRPKGAGLLHLLGEALASGGAHLLVLDGLERVQRQEGRAPALFGQIEDPLLKGLLTRIAAGRRTNGRPGDEPISADRSQFFSRRWLPAHRCRASQS